MRRFVYLLLFTGLMLSGSLQSCQSGSNTSTIHKNLLDASGEDTTVSPANNFFDYANGNWLKDTKIPASKSGWGSFYSVRDQALAKMRTILDSCMALKNQKKGSVSQQIGDLYASAMDSNVIEKAGISPLKPDIDRINAIKDNQGVLKEVATEYQNGHGAVFSFGISPDDKNSNVERVHLDQGGLGLPNKLYYSKKDSASQKIRTAYVQYITKLLKLSGTDSTKAATNADSVMALETRIASACKSPVELRDPKANYHLMSVAKLDSMTPDISWPEFLAMTKAKVDTVQVGQPHYFVSLNDLIKNTPVDVWKNYLRYHLVSSYSPWLSSPFAEAHFDFYNRLLNGQQKPAERWKRATSLVTGSLGDDLGQLYVKRYFPPEAKAYMVKLVNNLQKTYAGQIRKLTWMSDSTKDKAIDKLNAFIKKIGYPTKWKDYSSIDINRASLIGNMERIGQWHYQYNLNKLGKPVDKNEWFITPQTVNAYYNPQFNEIVFPAGILQPPFYRQDGDDAVNYGSIGAVIGHEMTHGFDDQGRLYDKQGNLDNWWTPQDSAKFEKLANIIIRQYSNYTVLDSVHVNGKLTLGENIADNGGLAIAYAAFKKTKEGQSHQLIDGLTPDQRFFMAFAQMWRMKYRPQRTMWRINNDHHSPEMYRVNGTTSNLDAFYTAFNVKPGDGMYRPDSIRVHIW